MPSDVELFAESPLVDVPDRRAAKPAPAIAKPPLSVLHLLIWVGLVTVLFGLWNLLDRLQPERIQREISDWTKGPMSVVLRTMSVAAEGATIGGLLILVARRRRGIAFPIQPGQWLLVFFGLSDLIDLLFCYSSLLTTDGTYHTRRWYEFHYLSEHLEYVLAFGVVAVASKTAGPWRWFLWTATIAALLSAGRAVLPVFDEWQSIYTHQWVRWPSMAICAGMLAIAVGYDLRRRTSRGWVHWVGVLAMTLSFIEQEIWYTYVRFLRY
jgi:hypothetical protein